VRREHLTPKNEFEHDMKMDVEAQVRQDVKAVLEEVLKEEVTRRTRVVGVFPNETGVVTLGTEIALRSSEEWALRRYLSMDVLEAAKKPNPQLSRH
jgi:hypothetical protein